MEFSVPVPARILWYGFYASVCRGFAQCRTNRAYQSLRSVLAALGIGEVFQ